MPNRLFQCVLTAGLCLGVAAPPSGAAHAATPTRAATAPWKIPAADEVRAAALDWLRATGAAQDAVATAEGLWQDLPPTVRGDELLARLAATLALGDPRAAELVARCSRPVVGVELPDVAWLTDEAVAPLARSNLRLLYARWLVGAYLYEEAAAALEGLSPDDVVDPASLLFYQAVAAHRLLDRDRGLAAIDRLEAGQSAPARYSSLAMLMRKDLEGLEDDSLDHIARRMEDIERRLDLGRAGPKTREVEDGVIKSLDKLIEEIEKQQQQQQQQAGAGGQMQPMRPAPDSTPMQGKGPGEVTPAPVGSQTGWGDLPPKEREEALQQIGQQFPAHYRNAIEQYFRRSAEGDERPADDER